MSFEKAYFYDEIVVLSTAFLYTYWEIEYLILKMFVGNHQSMRHNGKSCSRIC